MFVWVSKGAMRQIELLQLVRTAHVHDVVGGDGVDRYALSFVLQGLLLEVLQILKWILSSHGITVTALGETARVVQLSQQVTLAHVHEDAASRHYFFVAHQD